MKWIDTHTHFDMLETPPLQALKEAQAQGVYRFINIGTTPEDHPRVLEFTQAHYPVVQCALGVHPHDAKLYSHEVEAYLKEKSQLKEVIAIGEIGLDFYYMNSTKEEQTSAFQKQLQLAVEQGLPVEIHTRDAEKETLEILSQFQGQVKGLLHCFTGSSWMAQEALKLGLHISISGVVTFKKATELQEIVKEIPLDRIHIETDAPFLAPVPQRGKKNVPAFVVHTAEFIANLRGIPREELSEQVLKNTQSLFPKFQS